MKKIYLLLFLIPLILGGCTNTKETSSDAFSYKTSNNQITITGLKDKSIKEVRIPKYINELPVVEIADSAFSASSLTKIIIGDNIVKIGEYAFENSLFLDSISITSSVKEIGEGFLDGTSLLSKISVSSSNKNYCTYDGLLYTKDQTKLIKCPANIAQNFSLPDQVKIIGRRAFQSTVFNSLKFNSDIEKIEDEAFLNARYLSEVVLPDTLKSIGASAFEGTRLYSVTFPKSIETLGDKVLDCVSLVEIRFLGDVPSYKINANTFYDGAIIVEDQYYDNFINNSSFSSVSGWVFKESQVENKTIIVDGVLKRYFGRAIDYTVPNTVTEIGDSAFRNCVGLKSIKISDNVKSIGNYAFSCTYLQMVDLNKVETVGAYAFALSPELSKVFIPNTVSSIYERAFTACPKSKLYLENSNVPNSFHSDWNFDGLEVLLGQSRGDFIE